MENPVTETSATRFKISVIIPHLRGTETLLPMLDDLRLECAEVGNVEVLIVDNASTDGSTEECALKHPWVRILRLDVNQGYAGGCNRGIEATNSEWVLLLNDDIRFRNGALAEMLRVASKDSNIAAVQPKILSLQNPSKFDYAGGAGGLIDRFGYPFALGRLGGDLEEDHGQYDIEQDIFWASGACCLWRRDVLDKIGLLDESFFAHMEEIDLAWRALSLGWKIRSSPTATVMHLGGGTLAYQAWRKMFLNHRNSLIMLTKNEKISRLLFLIPARFILDFCVGIAELALGRPGRIGAIIRAWLAFISNFPSWRQSRKRVFSLRDGNDSDFSAVVYPGSILIAYLR
ncbi:glycosyltransferase family 2 protein, partial [bacterium]|nr:glycosyltransferase family 2 protein [bacterium]